MKDDENENENDDADARGASVATTGGLSPQRSVACNPYENENDDDDENENDDENDDDNRTKGALTSNS